MKVSPISSGPTIGDGILMPCLSYRFIAAFSINTKDVVDFDSKKLSKAVTKIDYSFADSVVQFTVEEPLFDVDTTASIIAFAKFASTISVLNSDGDSAPMVGTCFFGLTLLAHNCVRDYADNSTVKHEFRFEFANVKVIKIGDVAEK